MLIKTIHSSLRGKIFNVAGGKEVKVNKIAKLIGGKVVNIPKRPGEPDRSLANISLIKKYVNWRPTTSIEKGVSILLDNISYWKNAPVWTPKKISKATKIWFRLLKKK